MRIDGKHIIMFSSKIDYSIIKYRGFSLAESANTYAASISTPNDSSTYVQTTHSLPQVANTHWIPTLMLGQCVAEKCFFK